MISVTAGSSSSGSSGPKPRTSAPISVMSRFRSALVSATCSDLDDVAEFLACERVQLVLGEARVVEARTDAAEEFLGRTLLQIGERIGDRGGLGVASQRRPRARVLLGRCGCGRRTTVGSTDSVVSAVCSRLRRGGVVVGVRYSGLSDTGCPMHASGALEPIAQAHWALAFLWMRFRVGTALGSMRWMTVRRAFAAGSRTSW